jgi:hypothetical protein
VTTLGQLSEISDCHLKLKVVHRIPTAPSEPGTTHRPDSRSWSPTQPLLTPANRDQIFPPVYFLDHRVFQQSHMQFPKQSWAATSVITEYVGEGLQVALNYWDRVHWWMPIISKTRLYSHSLNPLVSYGVDMLLLLSTMKLLSWHPQQASWPEKEYKAIRHALFEAENAGILTLKLLQAKVLLTIFQFGHAIYPAAYFSVGSCARFGTALGVDQCLLSTCLAASNEVRMDNEEKKRVWWAILMLDRYTI